MKGVDVLSLTPGLATLQPSVRCRKEVTWEGRTRLRSSCVPETFYPDGAGTSRVEGMLVGPDVTPDDVVTGSSTDPSVVGAGASAPVAEGPPADHQKSPTRGFTGAWVPWKE